MRDPSTGNTLQPALTAHHTYKERPTTHVPNDCNLTADDPLTSNDERLCLHFIAIPRCPLDAMFSLRSRLDQRFKQAPAPTTSQLHHALYRVAPD